jgi:hypothetical protein
LGGKNMPRGRKKGSKNKPKVTSEPTEPTEEEIAGDEELDEPLTN